MPAALHASSSFKAPEVTQVQIDWFREAHFSNASVELFHAQFLQPQDTYNRDDSQHYRDDDGWYEEGEEEDDGLGYYPDGVKRTLTDEQIAIFRHSELESLRRVEAKVVRNKAESVLLLQEATDLEIAEAVAEVAGTAQAQSEAKAHASDKMEEVENGSEDGEIETEKPQLTNAEIRRRKRYRAKQRKKQQQKFNPEKKPDLRKRTWDVVETGMNSLDYDDDVITQDVGANSAAKRRQISYDD
ncbi:hypothetical protein F5X99DRAFT_210663 [Biscogniauxia marginata]|nr:hypothetical protein F5X99DRAFT_210663 [Biscogniauxia marginata]